MAWHNPSWPKRKSVTIGSGFSPSTLTNFPMDLAFLRANLPSARTDMRDVLFTDSDETTKLDHALTTRATMRSGGWTWFNSPRVIYHTGPSKSKYYGGGAEFQRSGCVVAWSLEPSTGEVQLGDVITAFQQDDHDNASVLALSSGKLVYFYARHGDATGVRYKITSNAEDITAFGSANTIPSTGGTETSYSNPFRFGSDIFVFYRGAQYDQYYVKTTETDILTNTWSAPVKVFGIGGGPVPYFCYCVNSQNANVVEILFTNSHPASATTSAYHMRATYSGGSLSFADSSGSSITLPATTSTATQVHDGATSSCWIWQIDTDGSGNPCILYTTFPNTSTDHRYWQRRWNGSAWGTEVEIATANGGPLYAAETYYTPGICFDGNSVNTVYVARWVSGQSEIQQYETSDGGATWSKTADITSGTVSGQRNIRPYSPRGHVGAPAVFYCAGSYASFTSFELYTRCYPPVVTGASVKLTYAASAAKTIYCYYGNSAAAAQENPAGVWDANYLRIIRAESPVGDMTVVRDLTGNANAAKRTMYSPQVTSGAHGIAGRFDIATNLDHWSVGSSALVTGLSALTIEAVARWGSSTSSARSFCSNWDTAGGCFWSRVNTSGVFACHVRVGPGSTQINSNTLTISSNNDHYTALAFDSTNIHAQVDGTESSAVATGAALNGSNSTAPIYIGRDPISGVTYDGHIYELRISNVKRSFDWRNATKRARFDQATYVTLGSEEDAPSGGASITLGSITFTGAEINALRSGVLSVTPGSIAFTGEAIVTKAARSLPVTPGSITFNGADIALTHGTPGEYTLPVAAGSISLAGATVELRKAHRLVCEPGAISFSGAAVDARVARVLAITPDSILLSGATIALNWSGAVAVSGSAARTYRVLAERRVYTVPAESRTYRIAPEGDGP